MNSDTCNSVRKLIYSEKGIHEFYGELEYYTHPIYLKE
jgi:hypothetical protein